MEEEAMLYWFSLRSGVLPLSFLAGFLAYTALNIPDMLVRATLFKAAFDSLEQNRLELLWESGLAKQHPVLLVLVVLIALPGTVYVHSTHLQLLLRSKGAFIFLVLLVLLLPCGCVCFFVAESVASYFLNHLFLKNNNNGCAVLQRMNQRPNDNDQSKHGTEPPPASQGFSRVDAHHNHHRSAGSAGEGAPVEDRAARRARLLEQQLTAIE